MHREIRVAFSPRAQPIWFRVFKWVLIIWVTRRYGHTRRYRIGAVGVFVVAIAVHLFFRWKTHGWTRPWGGWDDPAFVIVAPSAHTKASVVC